VSLREPAGAVGPGVGAEAAESPLVAGEDAEECAAALV
jgi:hypothetical protein